MLDSNNDFTQASGERELAYGRDVHRHQGPVEIFVLSRRQSGYLLPSQSHRPVWCAAEDHHRLISMKRSKALNSSRLAELLAQVFDSVGLAANAKEDTLIV